jgi:hypothetical protein
MKRGTAVAVRELELGTLTIRPLRRPLINPPNITWDRLAAFRQPDTKALSVS